MSRLDHLFHAKASRLALLLQLLATALILGWLPGNGLKLAAMLLVWAAGFRRVSGREALMFLGVNLLFAAMNTGALQKGIFRFLHPDVLSMPMWEFFMWGFYTLNALRLIGGEPPRERTRLALTMAVAFSVPYSTVSDPFMLLLVSGVILLVALALFHEPADLAFTGYLIVMGAVIEYVGVWSGQWNYPANPPGGVPLWFITMWGGVGLFTRRLLLPLVRPEGGAS
ncbi:MAG: hypothetical protein PHU46_15410 [Rhodocyclaceae bacterium]|nr:hypothetical protein [Rhodocyclaceae bacterium]